MAKVYEIDGVIPVVDPMAFVHPDSVLIGDVIVGPHAYIGPCACLRGDMGRISIAEGASVQDTCVIHSFPNVETVIDQKGHIGHGAIVHGCRVGVGALVGMNAVIMDGAVVGDNALVAAGSLVKSGFEIPPGQLAAGTPARVLRVLTVDERQWMQQGAEEYVQLASRSMETLKAVEPLSRVEKKRKK
ncbi:MAG: hypothetical protein KFF68_11960, partial [Desulfosarcina sp.]|nr:hypothetical protein [Desulfosarcina sp.]